MMELNKTTRVVAQTVPHRGCISRVYICPFSTTAQDRAAFSQRIRELVREVRGVFVFETVRFNSDTSVDSNKKS